MDAIDMEAGVTELDEIFEHSILNKLLEELDDDTTQDMDAIMEENDCVNIAGVENDCGFGSMNLHCLPYLAEQRLPEGPCNLELEIPPVPLPLRVVFRQMLGDGVFQVAPLDAVGVLLCTGVSAVPTLAGIYSCEFL